MTTPIGNLLGDVLERHGINQNAVVEDMMMKFRVDSVPVAQPRQRQRVAKLNGKMAAMNYTPAKHPVNAFKASVAEAAAKVVPVPLDGPVALVLCFVLPRPKSLVWKSKPMPRVWCPKRPDCDNLAKAVLDAMAGCWRDDSQVCRLEIVKVIAAGDEQPHVEISIESLIENMSHDKN